MSIVPTSIMSTNPSSGPHPNVGGAGLDVVSFTEHRYNDSPL